MGNATNTTARITDVLRAAQHELCATESLTQDDARLEAEILLGHALKQNRTFLRTWPERELSQEQSEKFQTLLSRRCDGEPIAYIIGERDEHTSELQSRGLISYAVFCLKKKNIHKDSPTRSVNCDR